MAFKLEALNPLSPFVDFWLVTDKMMSKGSKNFQKPVSGNVFASGLTRSWIEVSRFLNVSGTVISASGSCC